MKVGSKRPCSTTSATATAAARLASKPIIQPAERQPSPPKQPRPAGAQHVANFAAAQKAGPKQPSIAPKPPVQQPVCSAVPPDHASGPPAVQQHAPVSQAAAAGAPAATSAVQRAAASGGQRGGASGGSRSRPPAKNNHSIPRAASGDNSRKPAAAGNKRGRAGSGSLGSQEQQQVQHPQQQQRISSSPPDPVPSSNLNSPDPASNSAGALSLPTPHRRSRLTAGLLAAAAAGGTESRPAQTVMEVNMMHMHVPSCGTQLGLHGWASTAYHCNTLVPVQHCLY